MDKDDNWLVWGALAWWLYSKRPSSSQAQTYTIISGDTLSALAQRFYGNTNYWPLLYDANESVIGENNWNNITVGDELTIPAFSGFTSAQLSAALAFAPNWSSGTGTTSATGNDTS